MEERSLRIESMLMIFYTGESFLTRSEWIMGPKLADLLLVSFALKDVTLKLIGITSKETLHHLKTSSLTSSFSAVSRSSSSHPINADHPSHNTVDSISIHQNLDQLHQIPDNGI